MLRITRGEDSKLTGWYFEIDRALLGLILILVCIGAITMISAGAAQAARMIPPQPWYYFIQKAFPAYLIGLTCLFGFSMLNKQQIIKISIVGLVIGLLGLVCTVVNPMVVKGSSRWANIGGISFMPADILKPSFIILTAWFLAKMHRTYGSDIFLNKEAWKFNKISWWPYLVLFAICIFVIFRHPDVGNSLLYVCVLFVMLFIAGFPWKLLPAMFGVLGLMAVAAFAVMPHIRARALQMFDVAPRTQVWYSINSIKHGGLFGSGDESYVKDVLPESTNDFVYSAIAEDWGAIGACLLVVVLFLILSNLIKHATLAKDNFVVYGVAGAAALFGGQICFNLMTALHLFINKGMTLPFVSYGGISFITFCVLFGMLLAIIREDTWNK
jgi:cell division protein FtsW